MKFEGFKQQILGTFGTHAGWWGRRRGPVPLHLSLQDITLCRTTDLHILSWGSLIWTLLLTACFTIYIGSLSSSPPERRKVLLCKLCACLIKIWTRPKASAPENPLGVLLLVAMAFADNRTYEVVRLDGSSFIFLGSSALHWFRQLQDLLGHATWPFRFVYYAATRELVHVKHFCIVTSHPFRSCGWWLCVASLFPISLRSRVLSQLSLSGPFFLLYAACVPRRRSRAEPFSQRNGWKDGLPNFST